MSTLLIKNMPEALRKQLQVFAKAHKRSMNQQAILSLADALDATASLPKPMRVGIPITNAFLNRAKRTGRQ